MTPPLLEGPFPSPAALLAQSDMKPVTLVKGDEPAPAPAITPWPWFAIAMIAAGILLCLGGLLAYQWSRVDPAERAFKILAFRLGLTRREKAAVRKLAQAALETKPVVLLLSADALEQAMVRADRGPGGVDGRVVARLHQRVVG